MLCPQSTVVNLLQNFYAPQRGQVLLDGTPIDAIDHEYLHSQISLVSQEPVLFAGAELVFALKYMWYPCKWPSLKWPLLSCRSTAALLRLLLHPADSIRFNIMFGVPPGQEVTQEQVC